MRKMKMIMMNKMKQQWYYFDTSLHSIGNRLRLGRDRGHTG
jgi:hypothetical protein